MSQASLLSPTLRVAAVAAFLLALACAGAGLLAACGSSSAGASTPEPSASPSSAPAGAGLSSPTPMPSPQITSGDPPAAAVAAVRDFWTLLGAGRLAEAKRTVVAPGSVLQQWDNEEDGIAAARFVRVVPGSIGLAPLPGATIEFSVDVWIKQDPSEPGVWGDSREHQLFEHVVRMSDGSWRMWDSGTGP